jgi:hypothetical protein
LVKTALDPSTFNEYSPAAKRALPTMVGLAKAIE